MYFTKWRYQQFHPSYLLGWAALGLLIGLAASRVWPVNADIVVTISLLLVTVSMFRKRRWWSVFIIVLCGLTLGWLRGSSMISELHTYSQLIDKTVSVQGIISDDPQYGDRGDQRFRIRNVVIDKWQLPGEIYVSTYSILDVKRGDIVIMNGRLKEGFGSYQASLGFATLVSAKESNDPVRKFRDQFAAGVRNAVEEPAASLGIGFVVGQRSALPESLDDKLRVVGLTHIVVASGYNLTILVRFARRLLEKKSRYLAAAVSSALMLAFVAVSGLSPSMTRASLVTGLSLLAWYYGRRFHPLLLILYVASLTAVINPIYIWSDIGWYLSFLAFSGVLILAPLIGRILFKEKAHPLLQVVVETIAAQIMTLPLILFIFGDLPVLSVLSNALVALFIPLAMLLTTIAGLAGMLMPTLSGRIGVFPEIVLGYILAVVDWLSAPAWSQISIEFNTVMMVASYTVVACGIFLLWKRLRYDFRKTGLVD